MHNSLQHFLKGIIFFSIILALSSYNVNAQTLVGHWKMDETTGATTIDNSASAINNGTLISSPTFVAGVFGNALQLNGTTQYATVVDDASLDITSAITLAAWIKPEKQGTQRILFKVSGSAGYELFLEDPSPSRVSVRFNGSLRANSTTSYLGYLNSWIHIAATYDGTTISIVFKMASLKEH